MPTATIGDNTGNTYSGTEDNTLALTLVGSDVSTINDGSGAMPLLVGAHADYIVRVLLKFSGLSSIPRPVSVSSATLYLYGACALGVGVDVSAHRVLRNWIEGTQAWADRNNDTPPSSCWLEYGNNTSWTSDGCGGDGTDRDASAAGTVTITPVLQYHEISGPSFAELVQGWINGDYDNYGILLTTADNDLVLITASEGTDGQRPYLVVEYSQRINRTLKCASSICKSLSLGSHTLKHIGVKSGITKSLSLKSPMESD